MYIALLKTKGKLFLRGNEKVQISKGLFVLIVIISEKFKQSCLFEDFKRSSRKC